MCDNSNGRAPCPAYRPAVEVKSNLRECALLRLHVCGCERGRLGSFGVLGVGFRLLGRRHGCGAIAGGHQPPHRFPDLRHHLSLLHLLLPR